MNPILQRFNHKGFCQSYLPRFVPFTEVEFLRPPDDTWCICCGSSKKDPAGKIVHHVFCKAAEEEVCRSQFKTTFTELKTMSVDGLIVRASKIAAEAHREMARKFSGDPYIFHPMKVAGRVMLLSGATPVEIAAAWLHDTLKPAEDAAGPPMSTQDLSDRGMPPIVVDMVLALCPPTWAMEKANRENLKAEERSRIEREWFGRQNEWVQRIKLVDRIENLMDLSWKDKDYMNSYCVESRALVEKIGSVDEHLKAEAIAAIDYYEGELLNIMMHERGFDH
jgi:hypothetical protein